MKILNREAIRSLDQFTIDHEPITSIDLMERASHAFATQLEDSFNLSNLVVHIFCGPGNNGGDGLAIGRILFAKGRKVQVYISDHRVKRSKDCEINLHRFKEVQDIRLFSSFYNSEPHTTDLIIDALFGSGLQRPLQGEYGKLVENLNQLKNTRIAVDIPSGMSCDELLTGPVFKANFTWSFELEKLAFFLPENQESIGNVQILDIGLDKSKKAALESRFSSIDASNISALFSRRKANTHKNEVGTALLIAGSNSMMGAATFAATACLRSGVGILKCHIPGASLSQMLSQVPEAIYAPDYNDEQISMIHERHNYKAIGLGCGLGTSFLTQLALREFFETLPMGSSVVLDADALNCLALNPELMERLRGIPCILTPHLGEFYRLFGLRSNSLERMQLLIDYCQKNQHCVVLKGPKSMVVSPSGKVYFNSTGNPGMATAGSGDVLAGIILSFLSQGFSLENAAIAGVYMHGLAGDLAAYSKGERAMVARDMLEFIPLALKRCQE